MTVLLYHDVLGDPRSPKSGFTGADAQIYKLDLTTFEMHLAAIAGVARDVFAGAPEMLPVMLRRPGFVLLSFDDGGASAWPVTAEALERHGWRGLFFVTTDLIGTEGFVGEDAIRALARAGHVVGSHSRTHPARMATLGTEELRREWRDSRHRLEAIIGGAVLTASVPGGYYSKSVAKAASDCGYGLLFTSEPRRSPWNACGLLVSGRFSVVHDTPPRFAARLATGDTVTCARQTFGWSAKKVVKALGGQTWLEFRKRYWTWKTASRSASRRR